MAGILDILTRYLPFEIAALFVVFAYGILLLKRISDRLLELERQRAALSHQEADYMKGRIAAIESVMGISEKAIASQQEHIGELERRDAVQRQQIEEYQEALAEARGELIQAQSELEKTVASLALPNSKSKDLAEAQRRLTKASRREAEVEIIHELQNQLQAVLAHAENLSVRFKSHDQHEAQRQIAALLHEILSVERTLRKLVR